MKVLGRYVLDTLQTFFPWDDDLYTYFKEHGLGSSGLGSKKLPLVYTDNCESTGGIPERKRNNVIHPRYFGSTYEQLKWKDTGRETQPIIPAEKPEIEVAVDESLHAPREKFRYLSIGVRKYVFSYYGFDYAKRYFEANGVNGPLPSLAYDSADPVSRQLMDPLLKIGIIETKTSEGFEKRKAQVALKLSQPKFSVTKRGVRGRAKGRIVENPDGSNFVVTEASDLATKIGKICSIGEDSARIE